jgi:hypothetical protein
MKSLQRLQQHILATDQGFGRGIELTPRAGRLRAAFARGIVVGATATATLVGAAAYVKVGPGSYDPHKLYVGDPTDSRVMASIYDHHRELMSARERVQEMKLDMISGQGSGSFEHQAAELRKASAAERKIASEFALQTAGLSQDQIRHITDDEDDDQTETVAQDTPRFRP